jgi:hypothetical protein
VEEARVAFGLWRNGNGQYWVASGQVGATALVLSGSTADPSTLRLVRVNDLSSLPNPFASSGC